MIAPARDRRIHSPGGTEPGSPGSPPAPPALAARRSPARRKLATHIREKLLSEIRAGRWRPGDRLPTEPELMARFGVSRTPVREAMQSLSLLGVVDISPRRGATVRALAVESVVDLAILSGTMDPARSVADLFEFRLATESAIAGLAARNATGAQLAAMGTILAEIGSAVARGDRERAREVDVRFHAAIAAASGNVVFESVVHALNGLLFELRRLTEGIPGASEASLAEHRDIFEAIRLRDAPGARLAAERHIERTRSRYEAARAQRVAGN